MAVHGITPEMPPNPAPWIIERLMEVGPVELAGPDRAAISWQSIRAWRLETCTPVQPWEQRLLRRLSQDFLTASRAAEDITCPPPYPPAAAQMTAANEAHMRVLRD